MSRASSSNQGEFPTFACDSFPFYERQGYIHSRTTWRIRHSNVSLGLEGPRHLLCCGTGLGACVNASQQRLGRSPWTAIRIERSERTRRVEHT